MKKRVLAILICLVLAVCALAACGEDAHVHTFSSTWTNDSEGHWYEPTCDCEDAPIMKLNHADKNNDGACDVCEYAQCDHTYAEDWTADCTNHWNAASCGHIIAGANVSAHVDDIADGRCDVCNYIINDIHEHYYSTEWTGDAEYHWHAALCEHAVELADKAAHELNAAGYCTICDAKILEIDMTNLEAVLKAAIDNNYKVVTGSVLHEQIVYNGSESQNTLELLDSALDEVYFVLGNDQSYFFLKDYDENGTLIGGESQWFEKITEEEIFGVKMDVNGYVLDRISGDPAKLNGYNYLPGELLVAYDDTTTLSQTIYNMYDIMIKGENISEATTSYNAENGKYAFSYTYWTKNEATSGGTFLSRDLLLCEVKVEFTVNDDFVIDLANFEVKQYAFTNNGNTENDLLYDEATDSVTKTANANPTYYTFEVYQTSGTRTFTTPYPKESLIPVDFKIYHVTDSDFPEAYLWEVYSEVLLGDTMTVNTGDYVYFRLGEPIPSFASFKFIDTADFEFSFVNNDPNSNGRAWYMDPGSVDALVNGYSQYIGCLKIKMRDAGEYTMTLKFGSIVKTLTLTIKGEEAPELGENTATTINVATTDTYAWDVDKYTYTAGAAGTYTFNLPAGLGIIEDGETVPAVDFYDNANGASASFYLKADEVFEFYVSATTKATWVITVSYAEGGTPDEDEDEGGNSENTGTSSEISKIAGTYYAGSNELVINEDGTMTYNNGGKIQNYTISISDSTVTYTLNGNAPYTTSSMMAGYFGYLVFDENGMPTAFVYDQKQIALTTSGADSGDDNEDEPEGTPLEGNGTESSPYIVPSKGDYVCAFPGGFSFVWYNFTVEKTCYVTLSTEFATAWFQLGVDAYSASMNSNGGNGQPVTFLATEGQTLIFSVADYDENKATIPFTVSVEDVELKDVSFLAGNWTGSEDSYGMIANYGIVINADGTGKGYYIIEEAIFFDVKNILYIKDSIIFKTETTGDDAGSAIDITFVYNQAENTLTTEQGIMWGTLTLSAYDGEISFDNIVAPDQGNGDGDDDGDVGGETGGETAEEVLNIGPNYINYANVNFTYTATEAGTLWLDIGDARQGMVSVTYSVNDGAVEVLELQSSVTLNLNVGDVLVVYVLAEGAATLGAVWTAN